MEKIKNAVHESKVEAIKIDPAWDFDAFDTVGEFPKQRTYAFYSTEFKEFTRLKSNSPTVSPLLMGHATKANT